MSNFLRKMTPNCSHEILQDYLNPGTANPQYIVTLLSYYVISSLP